MVVFLVYSLLSVLWVYHLTASWLSWFLVSQLLLSLKIPCTWWVCLLFSLSVAPFKIFSLSSDKLTMMCLGVDLFLFILLGVFQDSWMCKLMLFIKFGKFLAILYSNILSALSVSLLFFWDCHMMCVAILDLDGIPQVSEFLVIFL